MKESASQINSDHCGRNTTIFNFPFSIFNLLQFQHGFFHSLQILVQGHFHGCAGCALVAAEFGGDCCSIMSYFLPLLIEN